jgi:acetyl-CoA carboxylase biotin carboxyl carrier protein
LDLDLDQLKQILTLVREHDLAEFEIEQNGLKLKIRKDAAGGFTTVPMVPAATAAIVSPALPPAAPAVPDPAGALGDVSEIADGGVELAVVKSPIVGTFYGAPEPGAPSFVEVGATVKKGQVLCIIEAMKLMNEIDSEYDGEVVNIYVENGQPVQYGERLFAIKAK